jgi:hypothetical protein
MVRKSRLRAPAVLYPHPPAPSCWRKPWDRQIDRVVPCARCVLRIDQTEPGVALSPSCVCRSKDFGSWMLTRTKAARWLFEP